MRKVMISIGLIVVVGAVSLYLITSQRKINSQKNVSEEKTLSMESVIIATKDGLSIAGDYYPSQGIRGALLIHMMPETKESWRVFAGELAKEGIHALAIDLRGHGKSSGGPDGFQRFTDQEHQKSILDIEAGVAFLKEKGIPIGEGVLIGASIGANLALWYATEHSEIAQIVLLSAGLNYRGIETQPLVQKLQKDQRVFFVSSEDDVRSGGNNADMNRVLYDAVPAGTVKKIFIYQSAGHGTDMFGKEQPDLGREIVQWVH